MLSSCFLSLCPLTAMLPTSRGQGQPLCLPGRDSQSASFISSQGCRRGHSQTPRELLNYFLLIISALPLETHQQLCNLHFILLYVLALQISVGEWWGDWQTVLSLVSESQLYPELLSLENHLRKSAKSILKGSHCCHA